MYRNIKFILMIRCLLLNILNIRSSPNVNSLPLSSCIDLLDIIDNLKEENAFFNDFEQILIESKKIGILKKKAKTCWILVMNSNPSTNFKYDNRSNFIFFISNKIAHKFFNAMKSKEDNLSLKCLKKYTQINPNFSTSQFKNLIYNNASSMELKEDEFILLLNEMRIFLSDSQNLKEYEKNYTRINKIWDKREFIDENIKLDL